MRKQLVIIFLVLCLAGHKAMAQDTKTITGTVTDKNLMVGIAGVTINAGAKKVPIGSSDIDGNFSVTIAANVNRLEFTYVGYKSIVINLKDSISSNLSIQMETAAGEMEGVVVQGFQRRKRDQATGATVSISGKDIQDVPVSNVMELLQGRVAGVNIQNTTGMPGARNSIFVRGLSNASISGQGNNAVLTPTSPLFVIDGVPVDVNSNYSYGFEQAGPGMSPLSTIPPEDIESMDFLMDAMATALYGSRGAYGVIIINTKRGKSKTPIIRYTSNYFINAVPKLKNVLGGKMERELRIQQILNYDTSVYTGRDKINENPALSDYLNPYYNNSTNWQSVFYSPTFNTSQNVEASGGDMKFNYKANASYYRETGIIKNTGFSRYSLNMNTQYMPTTKFSFQPNISYSVTEQDKGSGNGAVQNGVASASSASSLLPPPSYFTGGAALANFSNNNENKRNDLRAGMQLRYEILKGINLSNDFSYTYTAQRENNLRQSSINNNKTEVFAYDDRSEQIYNRAMLAYSGDFHDKDHIINAYVFNEYTKTKYTPKAILQDGTPNDQYEGPLSYISSDALWGIIKNYNPGNVILGYGGTVSYNYRGKYMMDLSYRIDGTSTNGPNRPFTKNPAFGLRYNFGKEKIFERIPWVSSAGVYANWGKNIVPSGSIFDANGKYFYTGLFNNTPSIGFNWDYIPNPYLLPNTKTQYSAGLEASFLDYRINTTFKLYYNQSDNQIWEKEIADHNGFESVKTNEMSTVSYGYEAYISVKPFRPESDWDWTLSLNGALNRDAIARMPDNVRQIIYYDNVNKQDIIYRMGRNTLSNYLYHYRGVFTSNDQVPVDPVTGLPYRTVSDDGVHYFTAGDPYWTDLDGNYILDARDKVIAGNAMPKFTGGIQSVLLYKQFGLTISASYLSGRDILNNALAQRLSSYSNPFAVQKDADMIPIDDLDYWSQEGVDAKYPNPYNYLQSGLYNPFRWDQTLFQEDGSYFKINTISLSYNIPRTFLLKYGLTSCRIYVSANNVYTFSNYSGPDPENVSDLGRDRSDGYPNRRTYNIGLNVQF